MKGKYILFLICSLFLCEVSAQTLEQARTLFTKGEYEQAKPVFKKYTKSQPSNGNYNYWYGIILKLLKEKGSITVTEVRDLLDTSESTVRRDITALDKEGKLEKVFGGAVEAGQKVTAHEYTVAQKNELNCDAKRKIAEYAASLIEPDDFVFLDAGTTTAHMIDFIRATSAQYP